MDLHFGTRWGVALMLALLAMAVPGRTGGAAVGAAEFDKVTIALLEQGKPDSADSAVVGYLFKPAGNGPFPAIILMHGCDGMEWERRQPATWQLLKRYAEHYVGRGYVALVLDSFVPRHITNICGNGLIVSPQRRAWDAYSAASFLVSLGYVDRRRLVLQGDSHGGWTTLVALQKGAWHAPEHFAAAIAWYPYCPDRAELLAPLLILIGEADDWTSADRCKRLVERLRNQPDIPPIVLRTFPGATHAYDYPYPPRVNPQGHHLAYDAAATNESWQAIDTFLDKYIGTVH
jgi:dienelactone hydrolase